MTRHAERHSLRTVILCLCLIALLLLGLCAVSFAQAGPTEDKPLWNLA